MNPADDKGHRQCYQVAEQYQSPVETPACQPAHEQPHYKVDGDERNADDNRIYKESAHDVLLLLFVTFNFVDKTSQLIGRYVLVLNQR